MDRPSRNCKRRSAAEMLGKSPSKTKQQQQAENSRSRPAKQLRVSESKAATAKDNTITKRISVTLETETKESPRTRSRSVQEKPSTPTRITRRSQQQTAEKAAVEALEPRGRAARAATRAAVTIEKPKPRKIKVDDKEGESETTIEPEHTAVISLDILEETSATKDIACSMEEITLGAADTTENEHQSEDTSVLEKSPQKASKDKLSMKIVQAEVEEGSMAPATVLYSPSGAALSKPVPLSTYLRPSSKQSSQPTAVLPVSEASSEFLDSNQAVEPVSELAGGNCVLLSDVTSGQVTISLPETEAADVTDEEGFDSINLSIAKDAALSISDNVQSNDISASNSEPTYTQVRTYMLDKNNELREVFARTVTADEANEIDEVNMDTMQGNEDELQQDEECIIEEEGMCDDESLFSGKSEMLTDSKMKAVYENIQPIENVEDHYTQDGTGYVCKYCDESRPTKRGFVAHFRREHRPDFAPWICPICNFKCVYPASIKLHLITHSEKKPYNCQLCNRGFAYKQRFNLHMKYHTDLRDQQCPHCDLAFHEAKTLKNHLDRKHPEALGEQVKSTITIYPGSQGDSTAHPLLQVQKETLKILNIEAAKAVNSQRELTNSGEIMSGDEQVAMTTDTILHNTTDGERSKLESSIKMIIDNANEAEQRNIADSSVVQIMPVSVSSESGLPQTINVVITVPATTSSEKMGRPNRIQGTAKTTKHTNEYRQSLGLEPLPTSSSHQSATVTTTSAGKHRGQVDEELLPYCELLIAPQLWNGSRTVMKCKMCPADEAQQFQSVTQFCEHLKKGHADLNIKPYKCSQCDYACRVKGNLEQHIKFHATDRPFVCDICNKGFIQKYKLSLHMQYHANKREWKCEQCTSAFNDKQDLSRHMKNVHFPLGTAAICPECNRAFKNERLLDQHMHVHTGAKEYKCEVCDKLYSTRESLRSHTKGHQFQFGCEICAKPLGSYSAFIAHKRLHDPNQKGYECDICGKVLLFRATLESHKLSVHSNVRPYKCDVCDRAFKTKGQLNNHNVSHSTEKPYKCQICGYSVKRRDSLRQHMYRHADVKPFRCGRCGKEYTQKQALEIHLKSKHAGVSTFNCPECGRGYNTNYLLKKHMAKSHNMNLLIKIPPTDKVIIAQQHQDTEQELSESDKKLEVDDGSGKKQTVLINAHICEHCNEVFVSQHALAVHILTDHMNQKWVSDDSHPNDVGDISETIEIPIGEEMIIVQSVEPGMLNDAIVQGATRLTNVCKPSPAKVSLLSSRMVEDEMTIVEQVVQPGADLTEDVMQTSAE